MSTANEMSGSMRSVISKIYDEEKLGARDKGYTIVPVLFSMSQRSNPEEEGRKVDVDELIRLTKTLEQNNGSLGTMSDLTAKEAEAPIVEPTIPPDTSIQGRGIERSIPTCIDRSESQIQTSLDAQEGNSERAIARKKLQISKRLLGSNKYNECLSYIRETYPEALSHVSIVQKIHELQSQRQLKSDGIIGPKTYAAIMENEA